MKNFWVASCKELSAQKADFYSGARKIIRPVRLTYNLSDDDPFDELQLKDCGFTSAKMSMLKRNYLVKESIDAAKGLWDKRIDQDKYGSVGVTCFGHYVKGDVKGKTPRGSKMGPCMLAFTMTLNKRKTSIDVMYRTTELFKKFPADLVFLRDELLSQFDFSDAPITDISFHFANVTVHPMYACTAMACMEDPIRWLEALKKRDKYFYDWVVKWTTRYLCKGYERGILKFSQALRVQMDAKKRLDSKELQKYLLANHPGFRDDQREGNDEDDGD